MKNTFKRYDSKIIHASDKVASCQFGHHISVCKPIYLILDTVSLVFEISRLQAKSRLQQSFINRGMGVTKYLVLIKEAIHKNLNFSTANIYVMLIAFVLNFV